MGSPGFARGTAGFVVGTGRRTAERRSSQDTAVYLIKRHKDTLVIAIHNLIEIRLVVHKSYFTFSCRY